MMTGAFIALVVHKPALALPLAFVSHFAIDMIPHYGYGDVPFHLRDTQKHFLIKQTIDAYFALVLLWTVPYFLQSHVTPLVVSLCMLLAFLPDVVWPYQYVMAKRRGGYPPAFNWYARFHKAIQWCEKPWGAFVELGWFVGIIAAMKLIVS